MRELTFYVSIVNQNGKPVLYIRKVTSDRAFMIELIDALMKNREYEFKGILRFRNKLTAIVTLRKLLGFLE